MDVVGFVITAQSKPPLIENLALTFERGDWQFQPDPVWTSELEAYERRVNSMGRSTYSAPEGIHDDTVMARALMIWQAHQPTTVAMRQAAVAGRGGQPVVRRAVRSASR